MSKEFTPEEVDKLTYDWSEYKKLYVGKPGAAQDFRDYLLFMAGWAAHRNGGVL